MLRLRPILVALLFLPATFAFAGSESTYRVSFTTYGPVRIGMTQADIQKALGVSVKAIDFEDGSTECRYIAPVRGHKGVSFMLLDGHLARIDVDDPAVRTLSGAYIGASQLSVLALYKGRISVTPHFYTAPDGSYLTLLSSDKKHGVRFETDMGKVTD